VGELIEAIQEAKRIARKQGRELEIVASICGTEGDLQDLKLQTKLMKECGVVVFRSNAQATYYCVQALREARHG
jgi:FdrA protein